MDVTEAPLLTVREVAVMLQLNERTVIRLATDGELPGDKLGGQWRFSGKLIREWLEQRMLQRVAATPGGGDEPITPTPQEVAAWEKLALSELMPPGSARARLTARSAAGVVAEMAEIAQARGLVRESERLAGALALRESLDPTATDHGIALLHARKRLPRDFVSSPFILLARSPEGVHYGAPDGSPTSLFFLLALLDDGLHLQWLGHLSRALRSPGAIHALMSAPDDDSLRAVAISLLDRHAHPLLSGESSEG